MRPTGMKFCNSESSPAESTCTATLPARGGPSFAEAWEGRVRDTYGRVETNWIDRRSLLEIKRRIDHPRHQEDARILQLLEEQEDT